MTDRLKNFDQMWDEYPAPGGPSHEAKAIIGGRVGASELIQNTCVVRVSRSFNYSGNRIPGGEEKLKTVRGGDELHYAFRVREFTRYLRRRYGSPGLTHSYEQPGGDIPESFLGQQGVIIFEVDGWNDATGHADLWNGAHCRHAGYFHKASEVMLWRVPDSLPVVELAASVGRGGENRPDDVKLVQRLLTDRGLLPGRVDGIAGERTIAAITQFQSRFLRKPDGRVDPNGRTWRELLEM